MDGSPPSLIRTVVSPPRYCAGYAPPSPPAVKWLFASAAVKNAVKAHVRAQPTTLHRLRIRTNLGPPRMKRVGV